MIAINYKLVRSSRKTVAIHIRDGLVEVRAPHRTPVENIERFIKTKENWINEKLAHSIERKDKKESFALDYGSELLYRGNYYPIVEREGKYIGFDEEDKEFYLPPGFSPEDVKHNMIRIYKNLAKRDLSSRVAAWSAQMRLSPIAVKINSAKTRWGSCSGSGNLNFSWMLIMAEDTVIDYIVVHELAHLEQMNHSEAFWGIVERFMPNYAQCKAHLKTLQHKLNDEDWS